ncbi:ATP-binding protein [Ciceribacter naphthalenivorans]|uniref:ATP-binding protein n=2 Tax=Alphaproteobacteria TaxID=28211 RepID=A0A512HHZ8_9HYPH|nr:cell wall hydrolase [Sphingomonas psychrolutea]GEO85082.1 ATP-binding protein [Ciceribacter naphthalenivorans]GLR24584.1 ATP-binding protein [Ciceribacter naphthalenivorans]GLT07440.1 ATP-binding protein [Sphingomonas psychrolutea]
MRQRSRLPNLSVFRLEKWTSPVVFGLVSWLAFPSIAAQADLAGLITGIDRGSSNWRMVLTASPAGSLHQSQLAFSDAEASSALNKDSGILLPDGRKIAFDGGKSEADPLPDEDRVTRGLKRGRVVAVEAMQPPKAFTAGSVLQRTSSLLAPKTTPNELTAFVHSKAKPVELASFYFKKSAPKADVGVPAMLASLVTNRQADVLATAYAPPEPDFASVSPFDALLTKKPGAGRFVPKIGPDDHAWAASVLPPAVFSVREQQCLASGVYFEARGESVKGQAAVAQVILNRVRNPAYPDTICGVVYQNEDWRNRCQFSFACDNIKDRVNSQYHWKVAREVALAVTAGKIWLKEVGSSTHYHAIYVRPGWARTMKKVGRIGLHVFYRTYGGGWS